MKDAAKAYFRIFLWVCALTGVICLSALQTGWLVLDRNDPPFAPSSKEWGMTAATGKARYLSDFIAVDPASTYVLSADVRSISTVHKTLFDNNRSMAVAYIYLGLATYDEDKKPTSPGGEATRYPAARGTPIYVSSEWSLISGTITGESDKDRDEHKFRPGTRYVRVALDVDNSSPQMHAEIKNVTFGYPLVLKSR
ncbi:MAG: hypothetical protein WBA42_09730 [Mesorhizobium sp.]